MVNVHVTVSPEATRRVAEAVDRLTVELLVGSVQTNPVRFHPVVADSVRVQVPGATR